MSWGKPMSSTHLMQPGSPLKQGIGSRDQGIERDTHAERQEPEENEIKALALTVEAELEAELPQPTGDTTATETGLDGARPDYYFSGGDW